MTHNRVQKAHISWKLVYNRHHLKLFGCQPTPACEQVFVYINFYSNHDTNQSKCSTNYRLTLPRGFIDVLLESGWRLIFPYLSIGWGVPNSWYAMYHLSKSSYICVSAIYLLMAIENCQCSFHSQKFCRIVYLKLNFSKLQQLYFVEDFSYTEDPSGNGYENGRKK